MKNSCYWRSRHSISNESQYFMGANEIIWLAFLGDEDYRPERFRTFLMPNKSWQISSHLMITKISTHSEIYEIDTSGVYQA